MKRGTSQNSPKKQWKARSLKYSLLYASASIVMTWTPAEGAVNMFEARVEKPNFLRVKVR